MSENVPSKNYTLVLRGEVIPETYEGELVVSRMRQIMLTEAVTTTKMYGKEMTHSVIDRPGLTYCIEEACQRALECREKFPVVLRYGDAICEIPSVEVGKGIVEKLFVPSNLELLKPLYLALKK